MVEQIISFVGALMILGAYGGMQSGKMNSNGLLFLLLNLIGSLILAVIAFRIRQLGLTLLEGAWAAITLVSIARRKD